MSQFEAKSAFDKENGIVQVKFGERRPVLETELNEMQEIQNHKRKEVIKSLYADGLVEGATISVENGIFTISNAVAILEGEIITIDSLSIEATNEETIYLDMWYETLTYHDEIKKQGNQQSNQTIPNKILDQRIELETSRRIQRQFTLSKTNDKDGHFYLKLGKVVAGNFVKEKEISFLKEIDTLLSKTENNAKQYIDQQIQLVTETGIPKLMCYSYLLKATEDNQTVFEIPLSTFDKNTDTVFVIQNTSFRNEEEHYSIEGSTITLNEGVRENTSIVILILKNVPIGEEGSVSGKVIADGSLELKKLDVEVTKKEDFNEHKVDDEIHVTQEFKDKVETTYTIAQQTRNDFLAFRSALTEGFTSNLFSESFDNLHSLTVRQGYYDTNLKRLVV